MPKGHPAKPLILPEFDEEILQPGPLDTVMPLYLHPLHEAKIQSFCQRVGIHCYLPLKRVFVPRSQTIRSKAYNYNYERLRPMFTSYIFVRCNQEQRIQLQKTESVIRFCAIRPERLQNFLEEIRTIRRVENAGMSCELEFHSNIHEGDRFRIENGIWAGTYGKLLKRDNRFLWTVEIETLQTAISARIDPTQYQMSPA